MYYVGPLLRELFICKNILSNKNESNYFNMSLDFTYIFNKLIVIQVLKMATTQGNDSSTHDKDIINTTHETWHVYKAIIYLRFVFIF